MKRIVTSCVAAHKARMVGDTQCSDNHPKLLGFDNQRLPVVISCPHPSTDLPEGCAEQYLDPTRAVQSLCDPFVDQIATPALDAGASVIVAKWARAFVDVNRHELEIDPLLVESAKSHLLPPKSTWQQSFRVRAGLGVLPRLDGTRQPLCASKLTAETVAKRLSLAYRPYHAALNEGISNTVERFGHCLLVDLHSMPSLALGAVGDAKPSPQIVFGTGHGASCDSEIEAAFSDLFNRAGYATASNAPYAGGFITRHYGVKTSPVQNPVSLNQVQAIQIEFDRALYLDRETEKALANLGELLTKAIKAALKNLSMPEKIAVHV